MFKLEWFKIYNSLVKRMRYLYGTCHFHNLGNARKCRSRQLSLLCSQVFEMPEGKASSCFSVLTRMVMIPFLFGFGYRMRCFNLPPSLRAKQNLLYYSVGTLKFYLRESSISSLLRDTIFRIVSPICLEVLGKC